MPKKKTASLLDQLGASMDKKKIAPVKAPRKAPAKDSGSGKPNKMERHRVKSKNFSLYPEDFDKIKDIQNIIYNSIGSMPNASLAVRIALRSCSLDEKNLLSVYEDIKNQDNRITG